MPRPPSGEDAAESTAGVYARSVRRCVVLFALAVAASCATDTATSPTPAAAPAAAAAPAHTVTTLRGRVTGHDGEALPLAHVRVVDPNVGEPTVVVVDPEGRFELKTTARGLASLELTGVDHAQLGVLVVLGGGDLELDVKLGTYARAPDLSQAGMLVWAGDPERSQPRRTELADAGDGTFIGAMTVPGPEAWVQLQGFTDDGRIVNSPGAPRYEYDGGGDYRSVLVARNGRVEVRIDPKRVFPGGAEPVLTFADPDSPSARLVAMRLQMRVHEREFERRVRAEGTEDPEGLPAWVARYDWSAARASAQSALEGLTDPQARRAGLAIYFGLGAFDPTTATRGDRARAKELLGDMPPGDPGWELFPRSMACAVELSDDPMHAERFERLVQEEMPPERAVPFLLERLVTATAEDDIEAARRYYAQLTSKRFAGVPLARIAAQFDPDRAVQTGKPLPAFDFGSLPTKSGKITSRVTPESLAGKVVLLDFWATWCQPCVADMQHLHAAYDRFGLGSKKSRGHEGRKFEIVSISVDASADVVHAFRKQKWPMPWQHAHVSIEKANEIFGFTGIPFAVLVDERGTILASTPTVSGATLEATLERVLADPAPGD